MAHLLRLLPVTTQPQNHSGEVEERVTQLKESMTFDDRGVGTVSLWGMGGSGKTTVARAFFAGQRHNRTFQRHVFLTVGQTAEGQELEKKQRALIVQLARSVGRYAAEELRATSSGDLMDQIASMLHQAGPVLLVLDDLWSTHQLRVLLGGDELQLPAGSQMLLTTRKRDIVEARNPVPVQQQLLTWESAVTLLARHACGQEQLPEDLVDSRAVHDALRICGGLPLAIKVLGGMLCRVPAEESAWQVRHSKRIFQPCGPWWSSLCSALLHLSTCNLMSSPLW